VEDVAPDFVGEPILTFEPQDVELDRDEPCVETGPPERLDLGASDDQLARRKHELRICRIHGRGTASVAVRESYEKGAPRLTQASTEVRRHPGPRVQRGPG
jgi:hypothetical protein